MPYVTNGNIYAPVMMLAEKAAASAGKEANLAKLLGQGQTWTVDGTAQDPV